MIIFNLFTWNENFSSVCCGKIFARFTVMNVLHIIVILFLHCCRLPYFTGLWMHLCCLLHNYLSLNFFTQPLLREKCPYSELPWSVLSHIRTEYGPEKPRIRTLFTQFLFITLSCFQWWFKASSFSTFSIFHETHTPALRLTTKSYWKDWWHLPIYFYIIEGRIL